jgi:hypothetical protein
MLRTGAILTMDPKVIVGDAGFSREFQDRKLCGGWRE